MHSSGTKDTKRVMEVRSAVEADLEQLNDLYNHYVRTSACTFDIEPITMDARKAWFAEFGGRYRLMVAVDADRVLGYAHTKRFRPKQAYDPSVESTVYIHKDEHGCGIGKALYTALFDAVEGEDIHRVYAGVTMPNPASVALHEAFGFRQVAYFNEQGRKFDRYWDVAWFEKELS
jgi:phosphinothricin acetyltransferase